MRCVTAVAPHFHGLHSSLQLCCEGPWFTIIQEDGCDKGAYQSHIGTERNAVIPNWFQPCQCCCCLSYSREYLRLWILVSYNWASYGTCWHASKHKVHKLHQKYIFKSLRIYLWWSWCSLYQLTHMPARWWLPSVIQVSVVSHVIHVTPVERCYILCWFYTSTLGLTLFPAKADHYHYHMNLPDFSQESKKECETH